MATRPKRPRGRLERAEERAPPTVEGPAVARLPPVGPPWRASLEPVCPLPVRPTICPYLCRHVPYEYGTRVLSTQMQWRSPGGGRLLAYRWRLIPMGPQHR